MSVYRFAIGIANIMLTGKKDKSDLENASVKFNDER